MLEIEDIIENNSQNNIGEQPEHSENHSESDHV